MAALEDGSGTYPTVHQCDCKFTSITIYKSTLTHQFFGSAFMSFMAVAYVPAFLEDRATFTKERANGLYGALPFIISNFIIGLPFLCKSFHHLQNN
jgi:putative flippase GtrA